MTSLLVGNQLGDEKDDAFMRATSTPTLNKAVTMRKKMTIRGKLVTVGAGSPDPGVEPYIERERADGEGPLRVNEPLKFGENMYGLCFIA